MLLSHHRRFVTTIVSRRLRLPPSHASVSRRSFVSTTLPVWDKKTILVPTMGDSITEGTIVEWTTSIGQAVSEGDVVALVETDKVTIDIKAEGDGVVTQQFGAVDDVVEVGSKLYELDTAATGFTASSSSTKTSDDEESSSTTTTQEPIAAASSDTTANDSSDNKHRTPSINFLGKDGWEARKSGTAATDTTIAVPANTNPLAVTALLDDATVRHPMYGRPAFTEDEMEALVAGGATIAPQVASYSSGAKFRTMMQQEAA